MDVYRITIMDTNEDGESYIFAVPKDSRDGLVQMVAYGILFAFDWTMQDTSSVLEPMPTGTLVEPAFIF